MTNLPKRNAKTSFKPRKIKREPTLQELAYQVKGWDPRITLYLTPREAIKAKKQPNFILQQFAPVVIGKWKLTELGALHNTTGDSRLVEVVENEPVPESE